MNGRAPVDRLRDRCSTTRVAYAALVVSLCVFACGDDSSHAPPQPPETGPDDGSAARTPPPAGAFELPGLTDWKPESRLGWPVQSVHITSRFGWRVDPVSGRGVRMHRGLDFRGAPGDLVLSIGDGDVRFVGHDPLLGNLVIIDHGEGLTSYYGHLSDVLVTAAMPVDRGAAIGLVGNTGRSAAPHLHLTVKLGEQAIDPLEVIGEPRYRPEALTAPLPDEPTAPEDPAHDPAAAAQAEPDGEPSAATPPSSP